MSQVRPYTRHQMRRYLNSAEYQYARGYGVTPTARSLAAASSQYFSNANAIISYPFTVVIWFKDNNLAVSRLLWTSAAAASDSNYWVGYSDGAGQVSFDARNSTARTATTSGTAYTSNAWNMATFRGVSATDRSVILNADLAGKGTNTTSETPTPDRFGIGVFYRLTISNYWDGDLGRMAIWSVGLADADITALYSLIEINGVVGFPPARFVRPDKLICDVPLFGNGSPELDQSGHGYDFTLVNAPTKATTAPAVIYPPSMSWASGS